MSKFKRLAILTHLSAYREMAVKIVMVNHAITIDDEIGKVSLMSPEHIEEYYQSNVTGIEKTLNEVRGRANQLGLGEDNIVPAIKDIPEEKLEAIAKDLARAKTIRFLNEPMDRPSYMSGVNPLILNNLMRNELGMGSHLRAPHLGEDFDDILARQARNEAFSKVMSPEHAKRLINDLSTLVMATDDDEYSKTLSDEIVRLQYIATGIVTEVEATVSTTVDGYPFTGFMKGNHDE